MGKRRFKRDREGMDQGYARAFPQFTGGFAKRFGSKVRSGVFGEKLGQFVGGYSQGADQLNEDEAGFDSNYAQQGAIGDSGYQLALQKLQEELQRQRAMASPFDPYSAGGR